MDTAKLRRFAQFARRSLIDQIGTKAKIVLAKESKARREFPKVIEKLEKAIEVQTIETVIERVAYTWFNRFCALRFMDVNRYTRVGVVTPAEGQFQPEILADAKMGQIDNEIVSESEKQKQIFAFLEGKATSQDPQGEAYRLLVVAACNYWGKVMPFLFQKIESYTELLIPDDLLSGTSILAYTRETMTPEVCGAVFEKNIVAKHEDNRQNGDAIGTGGVEVIGWLYQYYISEKKDAVFEALKKNKKITPKDIPAATQLFTPHWIVKYLVENSLGRLWLLNRPNSKLIDRMPYYIPAESAVANGTSSNAKSDEFLRIDKPEEIKVCDPACGSGHMLTYTFDLLYAIYEEEGYDPVEIPEKILTHNLFGIEIDERAGELAAFALTMKARAKHRRFFSKAIKPHICVLENVSFEKQIKPADLFNQKSSTRNELDAYIEEMGTSIFSAPIINTLHQFEEVDNFGSLIIPEAKDVTGIIKILEAKGGPEDMSLTATHFKILTALRQAEFLSPKYHVVIANPPYMGGKGMNERLSLWLRENYEDFKSDLFSAFVVRNTHLAMPKGHLGFMTPFVWMFISSYEKLRSYLIENKTITTLIQLEYSGFDGATVPICTFTLENQYMPQHKGGYVRLSDFRGADQQGPRALEIIQAARKVGK